MRSSPIRVAQPGGGAMPPCLPDETGACFTRAVNKPGTGHLTLTVRGKRRFFRNFKLSGYNRTVGKPRTETHHATRMSCSEKEEVFA
jgi:hypothetical protein